MKNGKYLTQWKGFFDLDKEIAYINKMNEQGWKLVYIKGGFIYTFEKTYPAEYVTVLYMVEKEKVSSIATFAAQCGYESIPHTFDGIGNALYLTGKKAEVSEDFVIDRESRIASLRMVRSKYRAFFTAFAVLAVIALLEVALFYMIGFNCLPFFIWFLIVMGFAIDLLYLVAKTNKKMKEIDLAGEIFE